MKFCVKKILGGVLTISALMISSCSNDDGLASLEQKEEVSETIYEDFRSSFPEATDVVWEIADGYAVASFSIAEARSACGKYSVWYELKDAKKKMQCRTVDFEDLPEAVRNAFAESEYAAWAPEEEAGLLTRYASGTVETICVLRAVCTEGAEIREATLYYTVDGVLVKLVVEVVYDENYRDVGSDYRDWLPQTPPDYITDFVGSNYPQAKYLYVNTGRGVTKVKILDGHQARMLLFDAQGNWLYTCTQLHVDDLPENVIAAFRASEYAGCRIEKAEEYLTAADGCYYLLTVKDRSGRKTEVRFGENGALDEGGEDDTPEAPGTGGDDDNAFLSKTEIDTFLCERYPNTVVTKRDYDDKGLEVELSGENVKIKVRFNRKPQGYLWEESEWDLDYRQPSVVPSAVRATIDSAYADYQLYFLKYVETAADETYYEAGLKSASRRRDIKVKMDAEGRVLAEYGTR